MNEPLISIVLPTYNGGSGFLTGAIDSCVGQTHQNWELVIVDDASTDGTADLVRRFADRDSRVRLIRHASNRRLPAALNTGFEHASGELLTWTSDDNEYRPDALAAMADYLGSRPQVGLVYAGYTLVDEDLRPLGYTKPLPPERLLFGNCVGACFLYRRGVYDAVGPYAVDKFLVEDFDYWLRIANASEIACLDRDLYVYRAHARSLTVERRADVLAMSERLLAESISQCLWASPRARARAYLRLSARARRRGGLRDASRYLRMAVAIGGFAVFRQENVGSLVEVALGARAAGSIRKTFRR